MTTFPQRDRDRDERDQPDRDTSTEGGRTTKPGQNAPAAVDEDGTTTELQPGKEPGDGPKVDNLGQQNPPSGS